jgi:hypothetical protein
VFTGTRNKFDILTSRDSERWMDVLREIGAYDFYHLPEMSRRAEIDGEGKGVMLVYREGSHTVAFPMLLRRVEGFPGFENLWDVSSIYGYAGPIATPRLPDDVRTRFIGALDEFFDSSRVIAAFSRLHPLLEQRKMLLDYGEVSEVGVTISIDLTRTIEDQVAGYRKNHRYEIGRLRSQGFVVRQAGIDSLKDFIDIYYESMREVEAAPYYFFDRSYFDYLMNKLPGVMTLFVCEHEGKPACAAMFAHCAGIVQYHLAGTRSSYRKLAPMKLLLDEARLWAKAAGARVLHLGGGVGARQDSLYAFKRGFSDREHTFSVWKHVTAPVIYDELCREAERLLDRTPESPYFPFYRHPELQQIEPDIAGALLAGDQEEKL